VAGLTCSFVYGTGLQPAGKIHNNLAGDAHLLLFFHVRPANQPTVTGVDLCHEKVGRPCSLKHVSFDLNHLYQFIKTNTILNATQLTQAATKHTKNNIILILV
jgi:hypothetical protein